ncbi:uncharacterized protein LOC126845547 isoform X2 [Adelges cooleyi]|uniref:uncharacterized protein LOC126845547 isoform X2 n=1 Tax=Adelges cooleyi TaxID=133065 RepID=UPI002180600C|nr:uncharacterized protein LOC126845547 isoform X2 [Adelges cooleyi]
MTAVVSVPANEGISVKNERDDPEINAMALKIKENMQKTAAAASSKPAGTPNNVYINRAGRPVPIITIPNAVVNATPKDVCSEDEQSVKGRFGWKKIGDTCYVPYILRVIDNEYLKFVSVRIAETQLLSKYLNYLHADIYTCTSVKSHFITECEAKLLNEINQKHCDLLYGKDPFYSGKDYIVRLEDVEEFYAFIEVCYKKLLCNIAPGRREKCGFIRINNESVVPYCIKDNQKYVPLFYFEGETDNLRLRSEKLENWNLAYLKFCCKVQGIRNELFASDSCIVTSLEDIKNYFPPDTNFEEYWPAKVVDTQLLNNQKATTVNPPGAWTRAPPPILSKVVASEKVLSHPAMPTPNVPPQNMSMQNNTYQNGWPNNQMVNSYGAQAQTTRNYTAVSRNQSAAAQYYNGNQMLQNNGHMNAHNQPPPLVRVTNTTTPVVGNPVSYANASMNQQMTTMYNQMVNNSAMPTNGQIRQFFNSSQRGQGQMITPQSYGQPMPTSVPSSRMSNTQQRNNMRNINPAPVPVQASEIIDLSSPPSSPAPPSQPPVQDQSRGWELKKIPDRAWGHDSQNNAAYKIQKATLQGKTIHCINAKPYIYSDLMVTIQDLVQAIFPICSVQRCCMLLYKGLKIALYSGNNEQLSVLRENGRLKSISYADEIPLAMLNDIIENLQQLNRLIKQDELHLQQQSGQQNKRQRLS